MSKSKKLVLGLLSTTFLCLLNYWNNSIGFVYVPTPVLALGGVSATFLWVVKSGSATRKEGEA